MPRPGWASSRAPTSGAPTPSATGPSGPAGTGYGVPDVAALQNELDTYADVGLFGDLETPNAADYLSDILDRVYDDAVVIWPSF